MTHSAVSKLPLEVGLSLLNGFGKASGWLFSRFMEAPLKNLSIGLITIAIAFSASNALFWQASIHPAPLFGMEQHALNVENSGEIVPTQKAPHPLELAVSRAGQAQNVVPVTRQTPAVGAVSNGENIREVTNESLARAQQALADMGLFSGTVDGFYGPLTAQAIRAYELRQGLTPKGALSVEIIAAINNSPAVAAPVAPIATQDTEISPLAAILSDIKPAGTNAVVQVTQPISDVLADLAEVAAQNTIIVSAQTEQARPTQVSTPINPLVDKALIEKIQRGLASLGYYTSSIDGIAGESTAKAIREFENFKSYDLTGLVSVELVTWLSEAGALI